MKETGILVAGSGGQGVVFLGRLIAYGGMLEGREVTCFPSYGAEMRGGTANCTVIISEEMIGSPITMNTDILIVMNEASLRRFQPRVKPNGLLIFDSSLIRAPEIRSDVNAFGIPASEMAASITHIKPANMIMLGALLGLTGLLGEDNAVNALKRLTPEKRKQTIEKNREAIRKGIAYIADKESKGI